jgi:hypothetical protein
MIKLTVEQINAAIKELTDEERGQVRDNYHSFNELYAHRCTIFAALCSMHPAAWKSRLHSDGSSFPGWFIAGIHRGKGKQITYHLPIDYWLRCHAEEMEMAPKFDGHTSEDVLLRLSNL